MMTMDAPRARSRSGPRRPPCRSPPASVPSRTRRSSPRPHPRSVSSSRPRGPPGAREARGSGEAPPVSDPRRFASPCRDPETTCSPRCPPRARGERPRHGGRPSVALSSAVHLSSTPRRRLRAERTRRRDRPARRAARARASPSRGVARSAKTPNRTHGSREAVENDDAIAPFAVATTELSPVRVSRARAGYPRGACAIPSRRRARARGNADAVRARH